MVSPEETEFGVFDVYFVHDKRYADAGLMARLVSDRVVIELDKNNKTLLDALLQAGVPREQIVLAYAGESVDEATEAITPQPPRS